MPYEYDLVIRNGTIVDGTGAEPREADVAVAKGRIAAVETVSGSGAEEIDARGKLVMPGFVDIHTHYDGNVTWEDRIRPSGAHGVTTIVTGNCGVGFAPCRPSDRENLIGLMAGVEDIPEAVMADGLPWTWESFPEYLDAVAARPHDMDVAMQLPHSALRVYVMGQRAVDRELATPEDIAEMGRLTREAMTAGAIGFATSRTFQHRTIDGAPIPSVRAAEDELMGIALALAQCDRGVLQLISDFELFTDVEGEFAMIRRLVERSRRPLSFSLQQRHSNPEGWRQLLALTAAAAQDGLPIKAQVACRPTGVLIGHELSIHPFIGLPTYEKLLTLDFEERVACLRSPEVRESILAEFALPPRGDAELMAPIVRDFDRMFLLGDPPDYEQPPEQSIAAIASRRGVSPVAFVYDLMLEDDGHAILLSAAQNYAYWTSEATREMLSSDDTVLGLMDGGAHCGLICDASWPTYMLTHWTRDRTRGPRLSLPEVVKMQTRDTAAAVGLFDRGVIAPGFKADLNVVDYAALRLRRPHVAYDLPTGGRRILQQAEGYSATIVNGAPVYRDGQHTGRLPGRLVRGPKPAPAVS